MSSRRARLPSSRWRTATGAERRNSRGSWQSGVTTGCLGRWTTNGAAPGTPLRYKCGTDHLPSMDSKPSTVEETRETSRGDRVPQQPQLFLAFECDRPGSGGARFSLADVDEVVIGRGPERRGVREESSGVRRLALQVPASRLSTMHARIVRTDSGWVLEDAHSTNGSFVCGQSIDRTMVDEASIIELGRVIFLIRPAMPTPP